MRISACPKSVDLETELNLSISALLSSRLAGEISGMRDLLLLHHLVLP